MLEEGAEEVMAPKFLAEFGSSRSGFNIEILVEPELRLGGNIAADVTVV